jgi:hypothetical protein
VLVGNRSAETARSKVLGARELLRLEPCATGWGSSSAELLKLRGSFSLMIDARLLPTGVLLREIHTPSTSMPLWMARMPKGISSLVLRNVRHWLRLEHLRCLCELALVDFAVLPQPVLVV